ncbi:MAG: 2-5 ligase family protein [Marmoricola sp.]|jgi:2'-5' RNA ligase|nr:2-5 ligase family protein [Marmoricola sp.]
MPTIGVSLPVPEPWGSQLQNYRIDVGDEAARHIPTHITLLPPHEVADDDVEGVVAHLDQVASAIEPFRVHLRGTGTFEPVSPVVFVGVVEGISQCEQLAASVRRGPLLFDRHFPYHPHVTVAHHLPTEQLEQAFDDLEDFDAAFDVDEVWMYLHDAGSGWLPTHAFPLGGVRNRA